MPKVSSNYFDISSLYSPKMVLKLIATLIFLQL